jgi:hypothetical protein
MIAPLGIGGIETRNKKNAATAVITMHRCQRSMPLNEADHTVKHPFTHPYASRVFVCIDVAASRIDSY